ncbi:MAG: hypothetical protein ABSB58_03760 [Gemmatimonadales bacterium]
MSWSARLVGAALALAVVLTGVAGAARGGNAAFAAASGAWLALLAQVAAVALLRPAIGARTPQFMRRWVAGMAVRGASLLMLAGQMVLLRAAFPVIWMAVGYLGVLLPLLFLETRFLR